MKLFVIGPKREETMVSFSGEELIELIKLKPCVIEVGPGVLNTLIHTATDALKRRIESEPELAHLKGFDPEGPDAEDRISEYLSALDPLIAQKFTDMYLPGKDDRYMVLDDHDAIFPIEQELKRITEREPLN